MAASCYASGNGYTRIYAVMQGLSWPENEYTFDFYIYWREIGGSTWNYGGARGENGTNYAEWIEYPNYEYQVKGWARWNNELPSPIWRDFISNNVTLNSLPKPTISGQSSGLDTITFTATNSVGSKSTYFWCKCLTYISTDYPNYTTTYYFYNINEIKGKNVYFPDGTYKVFDFTTSGYQITFIGLHPQVQYYNGGVITIDGYYYFQVYTTMDGFYSSSAGNNGNSWLTYYANILQAATVSLNYQTSTSIAINRSNSQTVFLTSKIYLNGSWVDVGSSGYPVVDYGSYFTISGLSVNTAYYFTFTSFINGGNGTIGPLTNPGYVTYYTKPVAPTGVTLNYSTTCELNMSATGVPSNVTVYWYNSGNLIGSGNPIDLIGLIHNTQYTIWVRSYGNNSGLISDNYTAYYPSTQLLTCGNPSNFGITQPSHLDYKVHLFYSWPSVSSGTWITRNNIKWGTNGSTFPNTFYSTNNNFPLYNDEVNTGSIGTKFFQVQSVITDGTNTVTGNWNQFTNYYPFTVVLYTTKPLKYWTGTQWVTKPIKVYLNGSWQTKNLKYWDVNTSTWK